MTEEHKIIKRTDLEVYYVESGDEKRIGEFTVPLYIKRTKHYEYEQFHCEIKHKNVNLGNWDFNYCPFCGKEIKKMTRKEILEKTIDFDDAINRIVRLEKENAELKDDKMVMADNYSKMEQKFYDNLAKAKELLGYIVKYYREDEDLGLAKEINEAEQFLNSEVEK